MRSLCKTESTHQPNHSPPKLWLGNKFCFQRLCILAKQHCQFCHICAYSELFYYIPLPKICRCFQSKTLKLKWNKTDCVSCLSNLFKLRFDFEILKSCDHCMWNIPCALLTISLFQVWMKQHLKRKKFIVHPWHQEVLEWAFLDKHGFTLVRLDYKQTLCTLLCNCFAWCLNGQFDRPWDHEKPPTWKALSAHQGNSSDT